MSFRNTLTCLLAATPLIAASAVLPRAGEGKIYNHDGGDIELEISDKNISLGNQPPWYVLDSLNEHCGGLSCDEPEWTVTAIYGDDKYDAHEEEIKVRVESSYASEVKLSNMAESLKSVSAAPDTCKVTQRRRCPPGSGMREFLGTTCDFYEEGNPFIDQYETSSKFLIRRTDNKGFLNVFLEREEKETDAAGLCGALVGAAGAIAGSLPNGEPASAGLGVAGIFCTLA